VALKIFCGRGWVSYHMIPTRRFLAPRYSATDSFYSVISHLYDTSHIIS